MTVGTLFKLAEIAESLWVKYNFVSIPLVKHTCSCTRMLQLDTHAAANFLQKKQNQKLAVVTRLSMHVHICKTSQHTYSPVHRP